VIWLWVQFLICVAAIVGAGVFLVRFGDVIAERTGLGRMWAGAVLIATATSLPELFTGVGSIVVFNTPDITTGDLLGSCVFNLLLLVVLDVASKKRSFFDGVNPAYIVEAGFSLVLIAIVALGLFLGPLLESFPWIWPGSLLIPVIYIFALRVTIREGKYTPHSHQMRVERKRRPVRKKTTLGKAILGYALSAALVIGAATVLPGVAEKLAQRTGLGSGFVGTTLVAFTTSLPEIVTTVAAFSIGAAQMAFSNVIGSNMFNMCILSVDDMLYFRRPITSVVSSVHLSTAIVAMGMTAVVIVALGIRKPRKFLRLSWAGWVLAGAVVLNFALLFLLRR